MSDQHDRALQLIGSIYDAALDPAHWAVALDELADFTDSLFAHLFFVRPDSGAAPVFASVSERAPETGLNRYHEQYEAMDPRRQAGATRPPGEVMPDWRLVSQEGFLRSEFYNDFYEPLGLRWLACASAVKTPSFVSCVGLTRGNGESAYSNDDCRRLAMILPHIARASMIHNRLNELHASASVGFEVLDRLPVGIIVFDSKGHATFHNASAERFLREDDGLTLSERRGLEAARHVDTLALHRALGHAMRLHERRTFDDCEVVRVARPSFRRPYSVIVAPASRTQGLIHGDSGAAAYAVIVDPERRIAPMSEMLSRLHGLTPAESEVASRLAEGQSLIEIAATRGSSVHTVRWLLKQAMAKTETHSQADLVSLILSGATLLDARI